MSVKRGSNFIPLVLDTRLLVAINGKASSKNQLNATYIMGLLVEHCKNDLDPNVYQELKERYEKTIVEQYAEKQVKEKERLELERRKLDLKERELGIREQNAQAYQETVSEKQRTERLHSSEYREMASKKSDAENYLADIESGKLKRTEDQTNELKAMIAELDQKMKAFLEGAQS